MKNLNYYLLLLLISVFLGCNNIEHEDGIVLEDKQEPTLNTKGIVSPTLGRNSTSNPTLFDNWENVEILLLNDGREVSAPWVYVSGNSMNIPYQIRTDIKREDGWIMLGHTLEKVNLAEPDYILFYHKKSGVLKGFYFSNAFAPNENAKWVIETKTPSSVIPSSSKVYRLSNDAVTHGVTSNVVKSSAVSAIGALNHGWNCFTFELPYGAVNNQNLVVDILGYNVHSFEINAQGTLSGQLIVPSSSTSNSLDSWKNHFSAISSFTGAANSVAGIFKKDNTSSKTSTVDRERKSVIGTIGIISAAASAVSSIIGGASIFTSKTKNVTHRYHFNGNIEMTGEATSKLGGLFFSSNEIEINRLNNNEPLGVWGITESPVINLNKYELAYKDRNENYYYHNFILTPMLKKESVVINPKLLPLIKEYTVSVIDTIYTTDSKNKKLPQCENYVKFAEDWYSTKLPGGVIKYIEYYDLEGVDLPRFADRAELYLSFKNHYPETFVSVKVDIEYKDGSLTSTSRLYKVKWNINDNEKSIIKATPRSTYLIFL